MIENKETFTRLAALGIESIGSFYCAGELIIGDPGHLNLGAIPQPEGIPSLLRIPAHKGNWHALVKRVEMEEPYFDQVVAELIVCYQGELDALPGALEMLDLEGQLAAESGQLCVIDSAREMEDGLDDDMMFIEGDAAIVRNAGVSTMAEGDGPFPLLTDGSKPHTLLSIIFFRQVDAVEAEEEALAEATDD